MITLKENLLFSNKFAKVFNNDVEFSNGSVGTHFLVDSPSGSMIVPFTPDGRVVMIKGFRYGAGESMIMFPQGCTDAAENSLDTAKRELLEETGMEARFYSFVNDTPLAPSVMTSVVSTYLAFDCEMVSSSSWHTDACEEIDEVITLSLSELELMLFRGEIREPQSQRAALHVLFMLGRAPMSLFDGKSSAYIWGAMVATRGGNVLNNPYRNLEVLHSYERDFANGFQMMHDLLN